MYNNKGNCTQYGPEYGAILHFGQSGPTGRHIATIVAYEHSALLYFTTDAVLFRGRYCTAVGG